MDGLLRVGYGVYSFFEFDQWHAVHGHVHGQQRHLHYCEHERHNHYEIPRRVVGGAHHILDGLRFGTQINHCRRGHWLLERSPQMTD